MEWNYHNNLPGLELSLAFYGSWVVWLLREFLLAPYKSLIIIHKQIFHKSIIVHKLNFRFSEFISQLSVRTLNLSLSLTFGPSVVIDYFIHKTNVIVDIIFVNNIRGVVAKNHILQIKKIELGIPQFSSC